MYDDSRQPRFSWHLWDQQAVKEYWVTGWSKNCSKLRRLTCTIKPTLEKLYKFRLISLIVSFFGERMLHSQNDLFLNLRRLACFILILETVEYLHVIFQTKILEDKSYFNPRLIFSDIEWACRSKSHILSSWAYIVIFFEQYNFV